MSYNNDSPAVSDLHHLLSNGKLYWLNGGLSNLQLDIVGFLAILGEGSLEPVAQVLTLSHLIYLPRLIPAPQTFLKTTRPEKLESTSNARVVGIYSGNASEQIHHVAHALHRGDKLKPYTVMCVRIDEHQDKPRPTVRRLGPLALLSIIGFLMSAILFGMSFYFSDGFAMIATISLSLLSTNTGIANKWQASLNDPKPDPNSPPGDVVIRYPQGAFIVVKCSEPTARYLYFNPSERCNYMISATWLYRLLSLISTLLLMAGVISLANATIYMQCMFALSYMLINIFYWIGAALPPQRHWDLDRFDVTHIELKGGGPPNTPITQQNPSYTEALWKAIAVTRTKSWLDAAGWTPKTEAWNDWLHEAEAAAKEEPVLRHNKGGKEILYIGGWDFKKALSMHLNSRSHTWKEGKEDV